ncbi:MAG: phosphodiesterase [Clostridia bacterium]
MKLIIASDLHGSLKYGQMLIDNFYKEKGDELILLGDLYYHGPRNALPNGYQPMELANALNKLKDKIIAVRGNCDSEVDEMVSEFKFLDTITIDYGIFALTLTHGHIYDQHNMPKGVGDIFLHGHTHIGFIAEQDGIIVANPGSVTLPKGGTPRSYLTLDEKEIILKELESGLIISKRPISRYK